MSRLPFDSGTHPARVAWGPAERERTLDAVLHAGDDGTLRAEHPAGMTPRTLPPAGSRVELTVTTERGLFSGPAVVLRREEATQALHLTLAGELEKLQRRQYFRIDVDFAPQTSAVLSPGGVPAESVRVRVRSLSGGGLCFEADRALPMDHVVLVALPMEDGAAMAARAAVLESVEVASGCWRTRALFAALPDRDRQRIVRYVQRMQLAQQRHRRG